MGWFSAVTNVVKKAALSPLTIVKMQANVARAVLGAGARRLPGFTSPSRPAARALPPVTPNTPWSVTSAPPYAPPSASSWGASQTPAPTPAQAAWFPAIAAAVTNAPAVAAAAAPAAAPYVGPGPGSSGGGAYGGDVYTGSAYSSGGGSSYGGGRSRSDYSPEPSYGTDDGGGGELPVVPDGETDEEQLGDADAIDYGAHFSGAAGGLAGWTDDLKKIGVQLGKGAASGILTSAASAIAGKKSTTPPPPPPGVSPAIIAAGVGVAVVGGFLLLRRRPAAVAHNPRHRRRRRSRR